MSLRLRYLRAEVQWWLMRYAVVKIFAHLLEHHLLRLAGSALPQAARSHTFPRVGPSKAGKVSHSLITPEVVRSVHKIVSAEAYDVTLGEVGREGSD